MHRRSQTEDIITRRGEDAGASEDLRRLQRDVKDSGTLSKDYRGKTEGKEKGGADVYGRCVSAVPTDVSTADVRQDIMLHKTNCSERELHPGHQTGGEPFILFPYISAPM